MEFSRTRCLVVTLALTAASALADMSGGGVPPVGAWYVRRATAQETWDASHEAMLRASVQFGPWYCIGPFDHTNGKGFAAAYGPEEGVDLAASYTGADGQTVHWQQESRLKDGVINDLRIFSRNDNVAAYVFRVINCPADMPLPVKLGSDDTLTVWLNGRQLLAHNVTRACGLADERLTLPLVKGRNGLLMKICQGNGGFGFAFTAAAISEAMDNALAARLRQDFGAEADACLAEMAMSRELQRQSAALERDLANRGHFRQVAAQAFRPDALILDSDRDPADVVLRRTAALLTFLRARAAGTGPQRLWTAQAAELAALRKRGASGEVADRKARSRLYLDACALRRRIAFSNPALDFRRILFVKHHRKGNSEGEGHHMCDQYFGFKAIAGGGVYILEDAFGAAPHIRDLLAETPCENGRYQGRTLTPGAFLSPDLSYDGREVLFAYTEANRAKWFVWCESTTYHIFKMNVDGTGLTQLTDGSYNDFDPCWLPDGRIVFISERRGGFGRCHGRPVPTWTLHTMNADGSGIQCISYHETNEWHPSIDHSGMIVYTRWDYVDRGFQQAHHPWITSPNGIDARAIHGNYPVHWQDRPCMELDVRAVPRSRRYIATAAGHHGQAYGSLVMIDPAVADDDHMAPVKRITPETRFPESEGGHEDFGTAWPLSEDVYLCVWDPEGHRRQGHYGIYLLDSFGNRELLYRDEHIGCLSPIPLRPRPVPPVVPPSPPAAVPEGFGTMAVMDVYNGGKPWPENTRITALRIIQVLPKSTPRANDPRIGYGDQKSARAVLGTVPVEADGSAYFQVPAGRPVYFQALNEQGMAIQSMRSDTYVGSGQHITCQGCHEPRHQAPRRAGGPALALRRAPSEITPELEGSNPFNFPRLVQPVLDRNCVACHRKAPKAPDLAGDRFGAHGWSVAYGNLQRWAFYFDGAAFNVSRTTPGQFGAMASRLLQVLRDPSGPHGKLALAPGDVHRLALWLDCNSDFYGAYENTQAQARGEVVMPSIE